MHDMRGRWGIGGGGGGGSRCRQRSVGGRGSSRCGDPNSNEDCVSIFIAQVPDILALGAVDEES